MSGFFLLCNESGQLLLHETWLFPVYYGVERAACKIGRGICICVMPIHLVSEKTAMVDRQSRWCESVSFCAEGGSVKSLMSRSSSSTGKQFFILGNILERLKAKNRSSRIF